MRYMFLIYDDPTTWPTDPSAAGALFAEYGAFTQDAVDKGVMVAGDPLHGVDTATTVRMRRGERLAVDGPFMETKEHLGGYYILDVADLDAAIEWAGRIPTARTGSIEVRPIMETGS